ncbi:RcnB family protein [Sphingomonas sabuli]|uniref:RcnB family protein n=1 Tax=Sphingomonas sabuli TaxID=2764186 RepID=A0A7G9L0X2_9SPHN|nr:RcnB family protein [Sphingomonas sabuli]QNM82271.1 RcnB family protein [Sphingomonas sabuli]
MRKILLSVLLATAVSTPALAQRPERDVSDRAERAERRAEARAERVREERSERREQVREAPPVVRPMREAPPPPQGRADRDGPAVRPPVGVQDNERAPNVNRRGRPTLEQIERVRERTGEFRDRNADRDSVAAWRERERNNPREQAVNRWDRNGRVAPPPGARPDRPAPLPETAHRGGRDRDARDGRRDGHRPQWRHDWRRDHRYDWHSHRRHNRSRFHLGFYFDPFGWGYQRYNVGWRLWPSYYGNRYWLNDSYQYRLPQAPWPYRWVRYYDDVMLVDTTTGDVVDVIYDFFW